MSLKHFTRTAAVLATTGNTFLTNLNHLLPIPKRWLKKSNGREVKLKSVRPRDRIRAWNIVPGDQIRLRGDKTNTLHEVLSINRLSNRVFVKGAVNAGSEGASKTTPNKNYHYSKCQLFVGNYEFPSSDGIGKPEIIPVFAERVSSTKPHWNFLQSRFSWIRFAAKTIPQIPWEEKQVLIPWPKPEKPSRPEPASYDTTQVEVAKMTYKIPLIKQSLNDPLPRLPSEEDFLLSLYNPQLRQNLGDSLPVDVYLKDELANPHSRAKKLKRWKIHKANEKALFDQITAEELKSLRGRTEREAKAEAAQRWREVLKEKREEQKKLRWKHKMSDVNMIRKARKKVKKEERQTRRLTELVLEDEPNQVIPKNL